MDKINKRSKKNIIREYKNSVLSLFLRAVTTISALICASIAVFIIIYIVSKGISHITPSFFSLKYTSENVSLMPALINTITMTVLALMIAAPVGMFAAVYLVEYARRGNRLCSIVRITAETLSGIPSVVYGLFGLLFFVTTLGFGYSLLAGALTLAIMILPLIMRTTEEALLAVPDSFREGSFGLGAGKLRTVFRVVLPCATPGILSGIILSVGRIVGETAALIYTAGTVAEIPRSVMSSGRTLSVHMYTLAGEGLHTDKAYATAVVLIVMVIIINMLSASIGKRLMKGRHL